MQTFLPYEDYSWSAAVLDRQRLGKQRVEVMQILRALAGETIGWKNHPAVRMWRGSEYALIVYGLAVCHEWVGRGIGIHVPIRSLASWRRSLWISGSPHGTVTITFTCLTSRTWSARIRGTMGRSFRVCRTTYRISGPSNIEQRL